MASNIDKLNAINKRAKQIRANAGSKVETKKVTKYNMSWKDALKQAASENK